MLRAVPGLGFLVGYTALQSLARADTAVSVEAQAIHTAAREVVGSAERSQVLFGAKLGSISQLRAMANDEVEVDSASVLNAEAFLRALPDGMPLPAFASEPDGSISLDWIASRTRLLTVSVGTSGRVAFAWLDGFDKGHGVARFDGQNIPLRILEGIRTITGYGDSALRAA